MTGMMWIIFFFIVVILLVITKILFDRNKKKFVTVIVVLFIVVLVVFFGLEGENRWYNYHYGIMIEPTALQEYELYLPLAFSSDVGVHPVMDELQVEGENVQVDIYNTVHGSALRIRGSGEVEIYSEMVKGKTTFFGDPMEYPEDFKLDMLDHSGSGVDHHWLFVNISEGTSIRITLNAACEKGYSSGKMISMPWEEEGLWPAYTIETAIDKNGWHTVPAVIGNETAS
ncbi:MAG: hypothetical protein JSV49_01495 [Thermoplasmata archaeon]|nr:MAG: hypothetical protein JSV49_01495 [Thermoplasmata archaeon]